MGNLVDVQPDRRWRCAHGRRVQVQPCRISFITAAAPSWMMVQAQDHTPAIFPSEIKGMLAQSRFVLPPRRSHWAVSVRVNAKPSRPTPSTKNAAPALN